MNYCKVQFTRQACLQIYEPGREQVCLQVFDRQEAVIMKHRIRFLFHRRKYPQRYRFNIYFILWTMIVAGSVYLLIRFALVSFSKEIGQAEASYSDAILYYISNKAMESGSSLLAYTMAEEGEEAPFPLGLIGNPFKLANFTEGSLERSVSAKEYNLYDPYAKAYEDMALKKDNISVNDSIAGEEEAAEVMKYGSSAVREAGIRLYEFKEGILSQEYILTNGAIYNERASLYFNQRADILDSSDAQLEKVETVSVYGDIPVLETDHEESIKVSNPGNLGGYTLEQMKNTNFLINNYYIVDGATKVTDDIFDGEVLINKDMTIEQRKDGQPQILIYHTHSQEAYIDSREGVLEDGVVGVGSYLEDILTERYGYQVLHDTSTYDIVHGRLDRNIAYNQARDGVSKILEENPGIDVIIDLHRDGGARRSTLLNGEETAQIMLFNGLSRDQNGPIAHLANPNLQDNLAFSLQLQLKGIEKYPGLFYKNYLKCWRYNLHLRPRCILVELGTDKNSLQSAMNAMEPFAEVLDAVLQGR